MEPKYLCRDVWNIVITPKYVPYDPEKLSLQVELKNHQLEEGQIFAS